MGKTKAIRTRCRCGLKYKSDGCPKFWMEGELTAYHDHVAQDFPEEMRNWIVIGRNGKFIPCAGGREGPTHFDVEREAWEELDKLYNDQMEWPEDETTIYSYESVRLQAEAAKAWKNREGGMTEKRTAEPIWKYSPGLWTRSDGARAERVTSGHRKGVWKAKLPNSEYILTETVEPVVPRQPWRGYGYAKHAKAALDARLAADRV